MVRDVDKIDNGNAIQAFDSKVVAGGNWIPKYLLVEGGWR
jgi:hypothetical protein